METPGPKRLTWQEKVKAVLAFHVGQIHKDRHWTIRQTAKALNRSLGGVSQDINLAYFLRSYPQMEELEHYVEALEWMRAKRFQLKIKNWNR